MLAYIWGRVYATVFLFLLGAILVEASSNHYYDCIQDNVDRRAKSAEEKSAWCQNLVQDISVHVHGVEAADIRRNKRKHCVHGNHGKACAISIEREARFRQVGLLCGEQKSKDGVSYSFLSKVLMTEEEDLLQETKSSFLSKISGEEPKTTSLSLLEWLEEHRAPQHCDENIQTKVYVPHSEEHVSLVSSSALSSHVQLFGSSEEIPSTSSRTTVLLPLKDKNFTDLYEGTFTSFM